MRIAVLTLFTVGVATLSYVDVVEAALCRTPNGQIINVPRPCARERFEMPVAPAPAQPPSTYQGPYAPMPTPPIGARPPYGPPGYPPQGGYPMPGPYAYPVAPPPAGGYPVASPPTGPYPIQASSACVVPGIGACQWPGAPIGSQCSCQDDQGNSYDGIAQ